LHLLRRLFQKKANDTHLAFGKQANAISLFGFKSKKDEPDLRSKSLLTQPRDFSLIHFEDLTTTTSPSGLEID